MESRAEELKRRIRWLRGEIAGLQEDMYDIQQKMIEYERELDNTKDALRLEIEKGLPLNEKSTSR